MHRIIQKLAATALSSALAMVLLLAPITVATAKNWNDGTAAWSPGVWNPAGVPTAGEAVNIVFVDGVARTVTLNVSPPSLGLLTVDLTGAGTAASALSMPNNNTLTANGIVIGGYNGITATLTAGRGAFTQSAGTTTVNSGRDFTLGYGANSTGTYTLSGTGALVANQSEFIGLSGNGTFNHSAGTNTVNASAVGSLDIGASVGSTGTYNLSGTGTLTVNTNEYIGDIGTGVFNQTGGMHTISGVGKDLYLGNNASGTSGTYTLSAGDLQVSNGSELIGYNVSGSFNQSGGTNTVNYEFGLGLISGATGTYTLSGGTLNNFWDVIGNYGTGFFNQTGGTHNATYFDLGLLAGSAGRYTLSAGNLISATGENVGGDGTGTFNQSGGTNTTNGLYVGERAMGTYNLSGTGVLTVTGGGTLIAWNTPGTSVNLSGGTINAAALDFNGVPALFNWTGGTLNLTQSVTWDPSAAANSTSAALGPSLVLDNTQTLAITGNEVLGGTGAFGLTLNGGSAHSVTGSITVNSASSLTLAGGTLAIGTLVNNGAFNFIAGTLSINQAGASINTPIVTGNPSTINVNANNISLGSAASLNGFSHQGVLNVGANTITLNSAGYARLGVLTLLTGGSIVAPNGVTLASGSNLQGSGTVTARVAGNLGSVIEATGGLTLGDPTSPAGFNYAGELRTKQFVVALNSSAAVGLGNLTTLGNGASPGTLNATNGFVLDFDEAITGYGTINSTNTLAKRATINGAVQGNSVGQPITLSGYIKGMGTFDNVNFTGTFSPGLSPTIVTAGNLAFSSTSTLEMELSGTTAGSQYDQIQASGALTLTGILNISLIIGFTPAAGNSFNLLDWSSVAGTFSSLQLPTLSGGLQWNTSQLYTTGELSVSLPGDYNQNGTVDAADYVVWRKGLGTTYTQTDYDVWRAHFGQTISSGAGAGGSAIVPEPATLVLMMFAAAGCSVRPGRAA
jgi:hypothetical protein